MDEMFLILMLAVVDVEVEAGIGEDLTVGVLLRDIVVEEDLGKGTMIVNIVGEEGATVAADLAVIVAVGIGEIGTVEGGIVKEIRIEIVVEGVGVAEVHPVEVNGDLHGTIVVVGV